MKKLYNLTPALDWWQRWPDNRCIHTSFGALAGQEYRKRCGVLKSVSYPLYCFGFGVSYSQGLARSGTEYGPLTDLPDWSYVGKGQALCLL